jgi:Na+/H+ antiporter NhaD/arsenite permease-like protein
LIYLRKRRKKRITNFIKRNIFLILLLLSALFLSILNPKALIDINTAIDYKTIISLTSLIVIATALEESGYFSILSKKFIYHISNERMLFLILSIFSIFLASILTNDIALFIIIPLINSLKKYLEGNFSKLINISALSVNIGSTLTPIGNPQNIFIWHYWDIPFFIFILKMFPLFLIMLLVLIGLILFTTENKKLQINEQKLNGKLNKNLFYISIFMLVFFITAVELNLTFYYFPIVIGVYLIFFRNVLLKTNWEIIFIFILFFINIHLLVTIESFKVLLVKILNKIGVFNFSILISQIISNVPATILVSKLSDNWIQIAYGVNLAGLTTIISSLANLIAIKLSGEKKLLIKFHFYSIPIFIICYLLTYLILIK